MPRFLIPLLLVLSLNSLAGCVPGAPAPEVPGAIKFQTIAVPMVGGFCSYFAEDQPGKPCVDGMEQVFAAHPEFAAGADSSRLIEVTAKVSVTSKTRSNSANPPQTATMTVWVIDKLVAARRVN